MKMRPRIVHFKRTEVAGCELEPSLKSRVPLTPNHNNIRKSKITRLKSLYSTKNKHFYIFAVSLTKRGP